MYKITTNKDKTLVLKMYKSKYTKKLMSNVLQKCNVDTLRGFNICMLQYCNKKQMTQLLKQSVLMLTYIQKVCMLQTLHKTKQVQKMLKHIVDKKYVILDKVYLNEDCWE